MGLVLFFFWGGGSVIIRRNGLIDSFGLKLRCEVLPMQICNYIFSPVFPGTMFYLWNICHCHASLAEGQCMS